MADANSTIHICCRRCGETKRISEFNKDRSKQFGVRKICKQCHRLESTEYARTRRHIYLARASDWYFNNKERKQLYDSTYRPAYYKNNTAKMLAKTNRRRAAIRAYTPAWADLDKIKQIYIDAAALSISTGVQYEVDHIVPVMSDLVCGLHCDANLQIITSEENKKKTNKYWPNMW